MVLGAGVAVLLRILFTMVVAQAMGYPYLKLVGGVLLLWVAVKLVVPEDSDEEGVKAADNLWRAVWIVTIADIVMSLDNVIAIAASAETAASAVDPAHAVAIKATLIIFGLATSVPLIIAGSALLMALLERYPILVWGGGALLGWVAGDIITKDGALLNFVSAEKLEQLHYWAASAGALFVLGMGFLLTRGRRAAEKQV
jgi:YjbE family integral membrane protein